MFFFKYQQSQSHTPGCLASFVCGLSSSDMENASRVAWLRYSSIDTFSGNNSLWSWFIATTQRKVICPYLGRAGDRYISTVGEARRGPLSRLGFSKQTERLAYLKNIVQVKLAPRGLICTCSCAGLRLWSRCEPCWKEMKWNVKN